MDLKLKADLEGRITRLFTAAYDVSQFFANSEPLKPGEASPTISDEDLYLKVLEIQDLTKNLRDEFFSKYVR